MKQVVEFQTEITAIRGNLDKVAGTLDRAAEDEQNGNKLGQRQKLSAVNALLYDTKRSINMLTGDINQAVRELNQRPQRKE